MTTSTIEKIADWIQSNELKGYSEKDLELKLLEKGYSADDVRQAIDAMNSKKTTSGSVDSTVVLTDLFKESFKPNLVNLILPIFVLLCVIIIMTTYPFVYSSITAFSTSVAQINNDLIDHGADAMNYSVQKNISPQDVIVSQCAFMDYRINATSKIISLTRDRYNDTRATNIYLIYLTSDVLYSSDIYYFNPYFPLTCIDIDFFITDKCYNGGTPLADDIPVSSKEGSVGIGIGSIFVTKNSHPETTIVNTFNYVLQTLILIFILYFISSLILLGVKYIVSRWKNHKFLIFIALIVAFVTLWILLMVILPSLNVPSTMICILFGLIMLSFFFSILHPKYRKWLLLFIILSTVGILLFFFFFISGIITNASLMLSSETHPEYFFSYVYCNNTEIFNMSNRLNSYYSATRDLGENYELYYDLSTWSDQNYNLCAEPYCREICTNNVSSTIKSGVNSLSLTGDKPSCVCYYSIQNYD